MGRLEPRKIVIVSSCPQIDFLIIMVLICRMSDFIAFRATIQLLKNTGRQKIINDVYQKCKAQQNLPKEKMKNYVTEIYKPFTQEEISAQIAEMLTPKEVDCPVELVYQTIEGLHKACPNHTGDWYFTGNYPTPGGVKMINQAFIDYYENKE